VSGGGCVCSPPRVSERAAPRGGGRSGAGRGRGGRRRRHPPAPRLWATLAVVVVDGAAGWAAAHQRGAGVAATDPAGSPRPRPRVRERPRAAVVVDSTRRADRGHWGGGALAAVPDACTGLEGRSCSGVLRWREIWQTATGGRCVRRRGARLSYCHCRPRSLVPRRPI